MTTVRTNMRAMLVKKGWFSNGFKIEDIPVPEIEDGEVLISVCAAGVQKYDFSNGEKNMCPGFECSGTIEAVGRYTENWKVGDKVCAIIESGGYAEKVSVATKFLLPVPAQMPLEDAAAFPYALSTVCLALCKRPEKIRAAKENILIHEGASKIGLLAIKIAKLLGMHVLVTTGSDQDIQVCLEYGADECIKYMKEDVLTFVNARTGMRGVDFVLDFKGSNLNESLHCCAYGGKVLIFKLDGLAKLSTNLSHFVVGQRQVKVINFQNQNLDTKAAIFDEVRDKVWPEMQKFKFPLIRKFPMVDALQAHNFLQNIDNRESIILCNNFNKSDMVDKPAKSISSKRQKLE